MMPQTLTNRYRDLNLSFLANPSKKDISTYSDTDAVKQAVLNLINTKHYERPFHPEIGCNVTAMLFEPLSPITAINIKRSIQDVLGNFEPRVTVTNITVDANSQQDGYDISVYFYINNFTTLQTVAFLLQRVR